MLHAACCSFFQVNDFGMLLVFLIMLGHTWTWKDARLSSLLVAHMNCKHLPAAPQVYR